MPVYSTRELIPFVNGLEEMLINVEKELNTWSTSKGAIINSIPKITQNTNLSTTALIKADEALSEIGSATFEIIANRGVRLKTLIDELRSEMIEIAKNTEGVGSAYTDPRIKAEIDNAVSSVDGIISDGLKLDYRLQKITKTAMEGKSIAEKDMIIPTSHKEEQMTSKETQAPYFDGVRFVEGEVTVLDEYKRPILHPVGEIIHGTIDESGKIALNYMPLQPVVLYYPIEVDFKDVPKDMVFFLMDTLVAKNSEYMQQILIFSEQQQNVLREIQAMKGKDWTVDFSIMKNHQDIIKESITPKGLQIEMVDGQANLTFSYNDHPNISHFEVERWSEEENKFVPYDGGQGVIQK
ncbi:hypothetical protein [Oceanobacillus profundus]|uniref:Uncharacterized protein n=1 Tax=Oceanobacillus profundus TaxID=372463 RepID=A0A417YGR7_9BACI|nr:hypothetical protein [Oceanobacillus profundus]MBR2245610.1 hypothetical protein [Bacilli bacterium]MBR3121328.1 hypothetical protein [Oceanobacillus sp.]RHW32018.1 hypothetical protein D1B32_12340 [Oceanobacillus profundus]